MPVIFTGQSIAKSSIVGSLSINRYSIFNGLELPRRIDDNLTILRLGVGPGEAPVVAAAGAGGNMTAARWYAYRCCFASATYLRPVAVADGSGAMTRGNPNTYPVAVLMGAGDTQTTVTCAAATQEGMTHILIYRSLGSAVSQADAEAGPFYYAGQLPLTGGIFTDTIADLSVGGQLETDNFPPNAYRYAVEAEGYIFAGGNLPIGSGLTCTVTPGSPLVTISPAGNLFDGVVGWNFKLTDDTSGGANSAGLFYANYVDENTITLIDANGNPMNYDGPSNGAGFSFNLYLAGFVLRWSKFQEPEAWPATNIINFEGDITGMAQMPNQPALIVCTDEPAVYVLDLTQVATYSFKTNRRAISTNYSVSSHYSLCAVDGYLRGIDMRVGCIIQIDGVSVRDITKDNIPRIFQYLDMDQSKIKNWHCAYDPREHLFGAFVSLNGGHRICDFCIAQNTITQGWFFNLEKDLLSTGMYEDPVTGEIMVLGGTQGYGASGGRWGRIWCPEVYDDWIVEGTLRSGTITAVPAPMTLTVDNSALDLDTVFGLDGLWALLCDENGEYAQLGYISDNTADTLVFSSVLNGVDATTFNPAVQVGWKFYLGLIEMRWGPKYFDFDDPDTDKKVYDVYVTVTDYDADDMPVLRVFRGLDTGYWKQLALYEDKYIDGDANDSLKNHFTSKLTSVPRLGLAFLDRSYTATKLRSLSMTFSRQQTGGKK